MSTAATIEPFTMNPKSNKREADTDPDSPASKRSKTDMQVDEGDKTPEQLEKEARNEAFLNQVKKTSPQLHELSDSAWVEKVWIGKRYDVPKYQSRRVDVGTGPPSGGRKTPQRFQLRVRGRMDHKYGFSNGQWGATIQVNVDGEQSQVAATFNKRLTDTAVRDKWHPQHKNLLKQGEAVLRSKVRGVFKLGGEKLEFVRDDNDKKIPNPDEPGKFQMQPHDPPQVWDTGCRGNVPEGIKPDRVVDQDGNPLELSEEVNGMACIAVIQFTYVSFPSGEINLGKELVALRVNTEDRIERKAPAAGGADSFF